MQKLTLVCKQYAVVDRRIPIYSLSQKKDALSIGQTLAYTCALKNDLLSWI